MVPSGLGDGALVLTPLVGSPLCLALCLGAASCEVDVGALVLPPLVGTGFPSGLSDASECTVIGFDLGAAFLGDTAPGDAARGVVEGDAARGLVEGDAARGVVEGDAARGTVTGGDTFDGTGVVLPVPSGVGELCFTPVLACGLAGRLIITSIF